MSVDYLPKCCDLPTMRAGYTNRKAKRWCCKSRRRLRLREVKLGKEYAAIGRRLLATNAAKLVGRVSP